MGDEDYKDYNTSYDDYDEVSTIMVFEELAPPESRAVRIFLVAVSASSASSGSWATAW